jgi:hypothetical protein
MGRPGGIHPSPAKELTVGGREGRWPGRTFASWGSFPFSPRPGLQR